MGEEVTNGVHMASSFAPRLWILMFDRGILCRHRLGEVRNGLPPMISLDRHEVVSHHTPQRSLLPFRVCWGVYKFSSRARIMCMVHSAEASGVEP